MAAVSGPSLTTHLSPHYWGSQLSCLHSNTQAPPCPYSSSSEPLRAPSVPTRPPPCGLSHSHFLCPALHLAKSLPALGPHVPFTPLLLIQAVPRLVFPPHQLLQSPQIQGHLFPNTRGRDDLEGVKGRWPQPGAGNPGFSPLTCQEAWGQPCFSLSLSFLICILESESCAI